MAPRAGGSILAGVALAALVLFSGAAASPPQHTPRSTASAQESFDDLYQRGQRANAAIKTLTATFTETTTSSLLTRPLVAHGTVAVERPSRVVLHYTDPEARVVLIDGKRMTMSWPGRNIRQVTDIGAAQDRVQKYFVNGDAAELRRQFEIHEDEATERAGIYQVTMVPKRKQIREALAKLELWVDRASLLLSAMRMTFANGDTKTMTFADVVPNAAIEPGSPSPPLTASPPNSLVLFSAIVSWSHRRRLLVVGAVICVLLVSVVGLTRLSFDTDVLSLLPRDSRVIQSFRDYLARFGSLEGLYVVFTSPDGHPISEYNEDISTWVERLRAAPEIGRVDPGVVDRSRDFAWLADRQLLAAEGSTARRGAGAPPSSGHDGCGRRQT